MQRPTDALVALLSRAYSDSQIAGFLGLIRAGLLAVARPFSCGASRATSWFSLVLVVAVAATLQFTLVSRMPTHGYLLLACPYPHVD